MSKHNPEDYVKAILQISSNSEMALASTGELAKRLGVTCGTASRMIRILSKSGLVVFTSYAGAQLTDEGHQLAIRVLRNHRLIELFLVTVLEMDWDQVREEAEHLEHAVSADLIDRIDKFLGHPESDPHGDPIPRTDGTYPPSAGVSLIGCSPGSRFSVQRVLDQSPNVLRFLSSVGVGKGRIGQVVGNSPAAEVVAIALDGKIVSLGRAVAAKVLVAVQR
jgi:DtxR family Mn-dependent transcriptional regulator